MKSSYWLSLTAISIAANTAFAYETIISEFEYADPISVGQNIIVGDAGQFKSIIDPMKYPIDLNALKYTRVDTANIPKSGSKSLNILTATFDNRNYTEAQIEVTGLDNYKLYVDDKEVDGPVTLHPQTHKAVIKYMTDTAATIKPKLTIKTEREGIIIPNDNDKRLLTLNDIMYGTKLRGVEVSPKGNYVLVSYYETLKDGAPKYYQQLYDVKKGQFTSRIGENAKWMPKSEKYLVERRTYTTGRTLVAIDPATGAETTIAINLPKGYFNMSPTEDYLIFSLMREGAKEDPEIYQVIEPEDRQPGWRDRYYPAIYKLGDSPVLQPLMMADQSIETLDISDDGSKLLLMTSDRKLTQRPTTVFNLITLDLATMKADTIVYNDGFIGEAYFTPDAESLIVKGSPEAFNRIGCTLAHNVVPSMYDYQLYSVNIGDKSVKPLTVNFDPSVNDFSINRYDGKIYLIATDRDMYNMYVIDPKNDKIQQIQSPENVVMGMDIANDAPIMAYYAQNDSAPDALYIYNIKSGKTDFVERESDYILNDIKLGTCTDWTFTNSKGETVYCRYYLPDNFDASKSYPLIVNYYGGCSPSTRYFGSRYPLHIYASLGYVVLQIQPSGATGFGQEWSSRHVSTAGKGVAEDIIEGTKAFCAEMPYVNADKIGCIGASYGGFMTQYLQTVTDMFAAAISHAGISDHTSYWGEGYWGYSYSETSMGNDLPWTNPDLYVKQSPLYNAHKIHTPILFLHGDGDTNVPVGESIQMFTALKRLGVETALVQVTGENHHINDFSKRRKWQDTIFAWFAKYLQDDPTWWNAMYPEK